MMPLLLLPGMMCDARLFSPQINRFSARRPVQVAALTGYDSMPELAAAVLVSAPERFALAGLSMGGILAMELLRQAPDRVAGLALLGTNPLAEKPEVREGRQPQIDAALRGGMMTVLEEQMFPRYSADAEARARLLPTCRDMARALGADVFVRQSRALRDRSDQCDTLRASTVSTLILCGSDDQLCPLERHTLMKDLMPHAELRVLAGAGHLTTLERPGETTAALADWLEEL